MRRKARDPRDPPPRHRGGRAGAPLQTRNGLDDARRDEPLRDAEAHRHRVWEPAARVREHRGARRHRARAADAREALGLPRVLFGSAAARDAARLGRSGHGRRRDGRRPPAPPRVDTVAGGRGSVSDAAARLHRAPGSARAQPGHLSHPDPTPRPTVRDGRHPRTSPGGPSQPSRRATAGILLSARSSRFTGRTSSATPAPRRRDGNRESLSRRSTACPSE